MATSVYTDISNGLTLSELKTKGYSVNDLRYVHTKLGQDIDGEVFGDQSGFSVSLNSDGTVVAIGSNLNDGNGTDSGSVQVYQYIATDPKLLYYYTFNSIDLSGGTTIKNIATGNYDLITDSGVIVDGTLNSDTNGATITQTFSLGANYSIGLWINSNNGAYCNFFSLSSDDTENNSITILTNGANNIYVINRTTAIDNGEYNYIPVNFYSGSWIHIVAVFTPTTWYIYINGDLVSTLTGKSSTNLQRVYNKIGKGVSSSPFNLNGRIDNFFIYNEFLSTSQVLDIYNAGQNPPAILFWNDYWTKLGQDIDGEASGDQSGFSVSLNSDGTIVAIGSVLNDGAGSDSGSVRVYQYNGSTTWTKLGQDIDGELAGDDSGWSVSLNANGTIVAIGAILNDGAGSNSGSVRVYQYNNSTTTWTKLGQDIDGELAGDWSGWSVSLNDNGTIVAIGAPFNGGAGSNSGQVRVYQYDGSTTWTKLGQDIDGEVASDQFGQSVSLNSDGTIVAIGSPLNDGNGTDSGSVRVYKYNSGTTTWNQIGQTIVGEAAGDKSGSFISLNYVGDVVAIGVPFNDGTGTDSGSVRMYKYNSITNAWFKIAIDLDGEAAGDQFACVSLSSDGYTVAAGSPNNIGNGTGVNTGSVRVYKLNETFTSSQFISVGYTNANLITGGYNIPTLSDFSVPTKKTNDISFTLMDPTSNSDGSFNYTIDNLSVATISGNTVTIVGSGNSNITATQNETVTFIVNSITATFQVTKVVSSFTAFSIPSKTFGDASFNILTPDSNSDGAFIYVTSNTSVADIIGNSVTITGAGNSNITAIQAETSIYFGNSVIATFQVDKAVSTFTAFSIPSKTFGDASFNILTPDSNSDGSFSFVSGNTSVANIIGNSITITGGGNANISATQATTTNYLANTVYATFQVDKAVSSFTAFSVPSKTFGDASFNILPPFSNSDGSFSFVSGNTSVANIVGNSITITGGGNANIAATQETTTNYLANTVYTIFQVDKAVSSFTAFSVPTKIFGDASFNILTPISNSDGSFSFVSGNTSVANIVDNSITITGVGNVNIAGTQATTANYLANTVYATFQVDKAVSSFTAFSVPTKTFGDASFNILTPDSNSDGSFSFVSENISVANIIGNSITITGGGNANIAATQATTANYLANTVYATFQVDKAVSSFTAFSVPSKTFGDASFNILTPDSNSDGSFSFVSENTSVANIIGNSITITGGGNANIAGTQSTTTNYLANTVYATFQVDKAVSTFTNFSLPIKAFNDEPFQIPNPISNSNGSFSYVSENVNIATIFGNTITNTGSGNTNIIATQATTSDYSGNSISALFQVTKSKSTFTTFNVPPKIFGDASFQIPNPSSNSDGSFNYISANTSVATIIGNTVTIINVGNSILTATQAGTDNFNGNSVSTTFQVSKAISSFTVFIVPSKTYGDASFQITPPTSNSDGNFSYVSANTSVATILGNTVIIIRAGNSTLSATQEPTTSYFGNVVSTNFQVNKAIPSFTAFTVPSKIYGDASFQIIPPNSNSNGNFSYLSANTSVATIIGNTITVTGAGISNITAIQTETANYSINTITTSFQVIKAYSLISNFSIESKIVGDPSFNIIPPDSTGDGTFSYVSSNTSTATISGNSIIVGNFGNSTITAIQTYTSNYFGNTIAAKFQVNFPPPVYNVVPIKSSYNDPQISQKDKYAQYIRYQSRTY